MYKYFFLSGLFVLVLLPGFAFGQQDSLKSYKQKFDQQFGLDVLLYSGQYYYPETNVVEGSPYWNKKPLLDGNIYMEGKIFADRLLRYHMNLREFILVFKDRNGAEKQIILDSNKVDSIMVQGTKFIPNSFGDINNKYLQVINEGKLPCYISWWVEKNFITTGDNVGYHYLKSGFETYVLINGELVKIKKQKELMNLLPDNVKTNMVAYLRSHRMRWKKMNPLQLQLLIRECEKYME